MPETPVELAYKNRPVRETAVIAFRESLRATICTSCGNVMPAAAYEDHTCYER